jgi:hypothetical protein
MKSVQRIVIGTEIFWKARTPDRLFEHAAKPHAIHNSGLNPKSDNPTCVQIHHQQYPIRSQHDGFAADQINAPQAVLDVAEER